MPLSPAPEEPMVGQEEWAFLLMRQLGAGQCGPMVGVCENRLRAQGTHSESEEGQTWGSHREGPGVLPNPLPRGCA